MKQSKPKTDGHRAINRLKRIEGQIRGLRGMLENGKSCEDVLVQYAAVHAALTKVGYVIVDQAIGDCVARDIALKKSEREAVEDAMKVFMKYAEHLK